MPARDVSLAPSSKPDLKKILVLRFSSLGDIVMLTPTLRCLRKAYPDAQIDMVVREDFFDLIRYNPHLDGKMSLSRRSGFSGLRGLLKQINHEHYDLVYDAHRSLRTVFLMPFIKAEHKAYLHKPYVRRSLALTFKLKFLIRGSKRMLERFLEPLLFFGVTYDGQGPEVFSSDKEDKVIDSHYPGLKKANTIGLIPSAQWPGKRWPPERFRAVIEALLKKTEATLVVFGGPQDTFCKDLVAGLPESRVLNAQGKFSIVESHALLKRCRLVVANDTGLMHMADAASIPCVLVFGPTNADMGCLPFHPQTKVIEETLWCRPCSKNGEAPCIRGRRVCLENITPERVTAATLTLAAQ